MNIFKMTSDVNKSDALTAFSKEMQANLKFVVFLISDIFRLLSVYLNL